MDEVTGASKYVGDVKQLVCESFLIDAGVFDESTPLEDLGIDSRKRVQLLATLEIHFDIVIDLEERHRLTDVLSAAAVVADTFARDSGS
ncbi:MAG: acyl carrier protein [Actinomycetota bacterium]|jgi:acyl carrier protein|nr:acyl carrier protein [Actinomycetota bacterium]